jgi:hypothetical protein
LPELVTTLVELIRQRRLEYDSFGVEYERDGFCEKNGGYWVTHIGHHFDGVRGDFERQVANILYKNGHCVVLDDEHGEWGVKKTDGLLNGVSFDICSVQDIGKNNLKNHFKKCNRKKAETAIIYYPSSGLFSYKKLFTSYHEYLSHRTSNVLNVLFIVNGIIGDLIQNEKAGSFHRQPSPKGVVTPP